MAKRISLSTTKALLTVLPALHSLPWAYDSRPSDYHLNISFSSPPHPRKKIKKGKLADLLLGAAGPPAIHGGEERRAVVSHRRLVGQVAPCFQEPVTGQPPRWTHCCSHCGLDLSPTSWRSLKHQEKAHNTPLLTQGGENNRV